MIKKDRGTRSPFLLNYQGALFPHLPRGLPVPPRHRQGEVSVVMMMMMMMRRRRRRRKRRMITITI
jgi:hypothetical protein